MMSLYGVRQRVDRNSLFLWEKNLPQQLLQCGPIN